MEKVENVNRPLKKGEYFLVPCITEEFNGNLYITPVYNNPHDDKISGQEKVHYHTDYRFVKTYDEHKPKLFKKLSYQRYDMPLRLKGNHIFASEGPRIELKDYKKLEYFILPVVSEKFKVITNPGLISKGLENKCIKNGKCPHKGFNLNQVPEVNGVIKCPLHGLEFDSVTKKVINFKNE